MLKAYAERAAAGHQSVWPRVQKALREPDQRRRRRIPRRWLLPVILLPLLASAGTALAIYSHTSPIVWIFEHPTKPAKPQTVHVYYPPPESVSLTKAADLLGIRLPQIHGVPQTQLRSVVFQGATRRDRAEHVPSDKGSVTLIYRLPGQTVSLREYHSGVGPLVSKLRGSVSSGTGKFKETMSVITVDGSSYEIEENASDQVLFAEWKTLSGVLIVLNGGGRISTPVSISFVTSLLPHIH